MHFYSLSWFIRRIYQDLPYIPKSLFTNVTYSPVSYVLPWQKKAITVSRWHIDDDSPPKGNDPKKTSKILPKYLCNKATRFVALYSLPNYFYEYLWNWLIDLNRNDRMVKKKLERKLCSVTISYVIFVWTDIIDTIIL